MSRLRIATATGVHAVGTILPQLVGLAVLDATDYGHFSAIYLTYALGVSVVSSTVGDAWIVTARTGGELASWRDYATALGWVAAVCGVIVALVSVLTGLGTGVVLVAGGGAALMLYYDGARFHQGHRDRWGRVLTGDVMVVVGFALGWGAGHLADQHGLVSLLLAWTVAAAGGILGVVRPFVGTPARARRWMVHHQRAVRTLVADATMMNIGSIGTPYLLLVPMNLHQFGLYRAVSNVSAPARLVLSPLRPVIAGMTRTRLHSVPLVGAVLAAAGFFGTAAALALVWIELVPLPLGVISQIGPYAVPAGLYVAGNVIGEFFYMVVRFHTGRAALWSGRVVETLLAVVGPVLGWIVGGLSGAVWGYALATTAFGVVWMWIGLRGTRGR
ncbi:hypothetical protein ATJ97_1601 [Georgenia soli]|uniref:O-antigen/teichoic acid export membrane protein n=1 Tax=Georgenia soli TaxID=638953 RepID=A0A2A9EKH2_9MICO|nr:hypothetical protein [Georgenia soli]PFG39106.1 hypothetical protein ATJ97_1601 [Georgenia soli]